ncbi:MULTISPECIES: hypothetical protein [Asticcacaulis]|uniref:hypothetical protein n=1 Tax=Asticcacaulis TaxID=76890 RepID=UPI001AE6EACB|nr:MULTISPECIES: hypothetical protein [Asticcacaulis]MBP2160499.1 hypothetical protein [Asticcacaulis solisilvae]MDR6801544.1 hypothetical protein [Asticcacaulis sp. BE141]
MTLDTKHLLSIGFCVAALLGLSGCDKPPPASTLNIGSSCVSLDKLKVSGRVLNADKKGALLFLAPGKDGQGMARGDQDNAYRYYLLPLSEAASKDFEGITQAYAGDAVIEDLAGFRQKYTIAGLHISPDTHLGPRKMYYLKADNALYSCEPVRCYVQFPYKGMLVEVNTGRLVGPSLLPSAEASASASASVALTETQTSEDIPAIVKKAKALLDSLAC